MKKLLMLLALTILVLPIIYADIPHTDCNGCEAGKRWNCRHGLNIELKKDTGYSCSFSFFEWAEREDKGSGSFPYPPDRWCPAGPSEICGGVPPRPWHYITYGCYTKDGNKYCFLPESKTCWVTNNTPYNIKKTVKVDIDRPNIWVFFNRCRTALYGTEGVWTSPYMTISAYGRNPTEDGDEKICDARDFGDNKISSTHTSTVTFTKSIDLSVTMEVNEQGERTPFSECGDGSDLNKCCENPEKFEHYAAPYYHSNRNPRKYTYTIHVKTCPPPGEPNKKYALPDGSGCTECYQDSDCGENVCNFQSDEASTFICDTSDDNPGDPRSYANNKCSIEPHKIENDAKGCGVICGKHFAKPGEAQPFGGYTQDDINEKTPKCCGNNFTSFDIDGTPHGPKEFFHRRTCIGCESNVFDRACCDQLTDCVYQGKCYSQASFIFTQDFQAVCARGVWLGIKPKLLYGKTTYAGLPLCGDFICDLLSGENCWSCPTDCSLGKEFSPKNPEDTAQAKNNLNLFLCDVLGITDCTETNLHKQMSEKVSCMALCDTPYKSPFGYGKKLKDTQFCRHDCECISNNCVASDPLVPENKYCCPFGSHFDGEKCVQTGQITVSE